MSGGDMSDQAFDLILLGCFAVMAVSFAADTWINLANFRRKKGGGE